MKKPMNKIARMIMGVLVITMGMQAQQMPIDRVPTEGGISYATTETQIWVNPETHTSYTTAIFADSVSPKKVRFVLYTKSDRAVKDFHYIFGVNKVGYTLYPIFTLGEGKEFYTPLDEDCVSLFNSSAFEKIGLTAKVEVMGSELLEYGPYFQKFIRTVKTKYF